MQNLFHCGSIFFLLYVIALMWKATIAENTTIFHNAAQTKVLVPVLHTFAFVSGTSIIKISMERQDEQAAQTADV
jgi:hypothetical protein